jgi:hypothetical protein
MLQCAGFSLSHHILCVVTKDGDHYIFVNAETNFFLVHMEKNIHFVCNWVYFVTLSIYTMMISSPIGKLYWNRYHHMHIASKDDPYYYYYYQPKWVWIQYGIIVVLLGHSVPLTQSFFPSAQSKREHKQ